MARLYDQTANVNDMWQTTAANQPSVAFWTANGTKYPIAVSKGYQWLRNRTATKKIPIGSNPQTEYFVVHGDSAGRAAGTNGCCWNYGNMENHIGDDGPGTMTALYFGNASVNANDPSLKHRSPNVIEGLAKTNGTSTFSEGAIIAAQTTDATDNAIQANLTTLFK